MLTETSGRAVSALAAGLRSQLGTAPRTANKEAYSKGRTVCLITGRLSFKGPVRLRTPAAAHQAEMTSWMILVRHAGCAKEKVGARPAPAPPGPVMVRQ